MTSPLQTKKALVPEKDGTWSIVEWEKEYHARRRTTAQSFEMIPLTEEEMKTSGGRTHRLGKYIEKERMKTWPIVEDGFDGLDMLDWIQLNGYQDEPLTEEVFARMVEELRGKRRENPDFN